MRTLKGPAIFLAQFAGDEPPFSSLRDIARWAGGLGFKGVQIPSWDGRLFDLRRAAESKGYCDEVRGVLAEAGVKVTELSTHLQGQLVAVHPAYDEAFDGFAPPEVRGRPAARQEWAVEQLRLAARASRNLGLDAHATFSGALAWPFVYPWPQRPAGLVETAFAELAARWRPILDAFEEQGVDVCYEIHPGEDLHDGATFERFLEAVGNHPRCNILYDPSHFVLQALDHLAFIDIYHPASACSTPRTPSSGRAAASASMAATCPGWTAPGASARSATGRWISPRSSRSLRNTTSRAGRCWNGSAA
jgi:sugar phosphate isomerase/epimerase